MRSCFLTVICEWKKPYETIRKAFKTALDWVKQPKNKNVHELKAEYIFEERIKKYRKAGFLRFFGIFFLETVFVALLSFTNTFRSISIFGVPEWIRVSDEILFYLMIFNLFVLSIDMTVFYLKCVKREFLCVFVKPFLISIIFLLACFLMYITNSFIDHKYGYDFFGITMAFLVITPICMAYFLASIILFLKKRPVMLEIGSSK